MQILKISKKQTKRQCNLPLSLHLLTTVIPSSEFAGMNFQKCSLEKLIRKNSHKKKKKGDVVLQMVLFYISGQGTDVSQDFSKLLRQFECFRFGLYVRKLPMHQFSNYSEL